MFEPIKTAADAFAEARDAYIKAIKNKDVEAAFHALADGFDYADAILTFLGFTEPYACGDCDACQANAAAAVTVHTSPAYSMTADDEATARALLGSIFGDNALPTEFTKESE
jgi:hypothetical protein